MIKVREDLNLSQIDDMEDEIAESENLLDVYTPYADLMTLLLVFFVFFSLASRWEAAQQITEKNELIVSQNEAIIEKAKLDSLYNRNQQLITIPVGILFESGQADLKWSSKPALALIMDEIKQKLGDEPGWQVRIEGHTDNVPILSKKYDSNWELSTARALSIVKFMIENQYFPPEQLQAMGYGEFKPVAENDTKENRAKNRRVEIRLSKSYN